MKRITILSTLALGLFLVSCKKDKTETAADLLKAGKWQMIDAVIYGTSDGEDFHFDAFADMEECDKDDFMTFDDSKVYMDTGSEKCDPNEEQLESSDYELINDGTAIIIDVSESTEPTQILELTKSRLKIKQTETIGEDTWNSEITYTNLNK